MKKILCFLVVMLALTACTKEEVVDRCVKPQLYLDSCVVGDDLDAIAYIRLDMGENFFHHRLQLVLHDMDNTDQQIDSFDVALSGERVQKLKKTFKLPVAGKAYLACLVMKTDKNSFVSNSVTVASSNIPLKDKFFYTHGTPYYYDFSHTTLYCTDGVGAVGEAGENFLVEVPKCSEDDEFQLKVGNKMIKTENEIKNGKYGIACGVWGEIPDLPAGKYDVSLVWKGVDIPLEKKLHILPWKVNLEVASSKDDVGNILPGYPKTFCIGSKLYYCTLNYPNGVNASYDLKSNKCTKLRNVPFRINDIVLLGNKAYAITDNFDIYADVQEKDYLVEYDPTNDTWKKLAVFPNNGNMCFMHLFATGGSLYMCDGKEPIKSFTESGKRITQVWEYDLKKQEWKTKSNLPSNFNRNGTHYVEYFCGESMGYAMDMANGQLWTYDPVNDKWNYESILKTQYGTNTNVNIIEHNGKLLYLGHGDNSAVYSYDLKTHEWELLATCQLGLITSSPLPVAIYDNRIMIGPFPDTNVTDNSMYFLTVDLK